MSKIANIVGFIRGYADEAAALAGALGSIVDVIPVNSSAKNRIVKAIDSFEKAAKNLEVVESVDTGAAEITDKKIRAAEKRMVEALEKTTKELNEKYNDLEDKYIALKELYEAKN